jgi:mono/diheme cytochrome c family protein
MRKPALVASLLVTIAVAGTARAADSAGAVEAGRTLYRRYCAACHGHSAKGDGPVAPALGEKPTDLTVIARDNEGEFPSLAVVAAIDGTRSLRAHGVSDMPVWGEAFASVPVWSAERQAEARGKIILITEYLRSIQAR